MKNLKTLTFMMVLILVSSLATACTGGGKHKSKNRVNYMVEKVTDKLALDKDQSQKLRDLAQTFQEIKKAERLKNKADRETLKNMVLSEKLDKDVARTLFNKRQKSLSDNFDPVFEKLQAFHSSLTAEQRKEAVKYLEKFKKRFR